MGPIWVPFGTHLCKPTWVPIWAHLCSVKEIWSHLAPIVFFNKMKFWIWYILSHERLQLYLDCLFQTLVYQKIYFYYIFGCLKILHFAHFSIFSKILTEKAFVCKKLIWWPTDFFKYLKDVRGWVYTCKIWDSFYFQIFR